MKQIGMFTSMLGSSKTHSEEFKEAAEKEKHRKQIINAASRGDEKKLQILLTKYPDIDLNAKVNDVTPLMAAAINGKLSSVKLLLLARADPYVKDDKRGLTALELARKNKHKDVAEYLLNSMGDQEVFKILKSLGFARYWDPFVTEQITLERFKQLTDADYDRMGLPIGPRKQIQRFLKEMNNDKVATDLKSPRGIPRSASDALPSPRSGGRLPAGASAQSAPLGADDAEPPAVRTISSPQIAVTEPPSPRRHSPPTALSASSPSAVSIADASSGRRSPAAPKRTDDKASPRNVGGKSPRGKPLLAEADRKLMGQYVEYQRAEFDSPETGGASGGKKTPVSPRKKPTAADGEDKNYIYGGVDNLVQQQQDEGLAKSQPQMTRVLSDDSSSSDEDGDANHKANYKRPDESESESESDSDSDDSSGSELSSDEGPGDERKYGYREIEYDELVFGKKIGAGAFGAVYKGTWRGAPVAIKKLKNFNMKDKHMVEEFRREAKLAELVHNHPNIVKFVGACSKRKGKFCLVSMFCSGGSLDKMLLDQTVKITLKTTVRMAVEAASGIYHLHCEGVIHRDIAARNCLVGENFHIFVTDFGFARIKENATAEYARTLNAVGPVKHMSPEAMREKKYSEKSDAFSFGVLMWEMFTRQEPYAGEKDLVALAFRIAVQGHRLTIPSSVPGPVTQLMKDCWETDPHQRPNFKEILKRLSAYENTLEDTA